MPHFITAHCSLNGQTMLIAAEQIAAVKPEEFGSGCVIEKAASETYWTVKESFEEILYALTPR